ncbi:MAG: hypothetical protein E7E65_00005, partial [Escherichia coli]|nr:hypothetical protein [Escherichia coli]
TLKMQQKISCLPNKRIKYHEWYKRAVLPTLHVLVCAKLKQKVSHRDKQNESKYILMNTPKKSEQKQNDKQQGFAQDGLDTSKAKRLLEKAQQSTTKPTQGK